MSRALLLLLVLPLLGSGATALLPHRVRGRFALLLAVTIALVTLWVARALLAAGTATVVGLGLPIGVEVVLVADGLAVALLVMTSVVGVALTGFARAEVRVDPGRDHPAYWPLLFALWAGLHLLLLAGDLFTAYLMLELVALCASLLVTLRGDRGSLLAGTRYFYAELVASTTMLVGVALVWSEAGTVVFTELATSLPPTRTAGLGLAIMTAGLLLKAPLAPLHFWLPAAHTLAPSAVSPLLSGVMVKVAFAVLLRLWVLSVPELITASATQLLGAFGALAIVWGSFGALLATGLKRLIASSTVAQVGLLFLALPLAAAGSPDGWNGGVLLAVSHAVAKAAMLMAAAVLVDSARRAGARAPSATVTTASASSGPLVATGVAPARGETTWPLLLELRGSAARRPVAMMAFGIASISLVGLPPTGGFVAKWYLLVGSITTGQWWWVAVLMAGTLLTVGYLMRFVRPAFAPLPADELPVPRRDGRDLVALALAVTTLVLGVVPGPVLELLAIGGPYGSG